MNEFVLLPLDLLELDLLPVSLTLDEILLAGDTGSSFNNTSSTKLAGGGISTTSVVSSTLGCKNYTKSQYNILPAEANAQLIFKSKKYRYVENSLRTDHYKLLLD